MLQLFEGSAYVLRITDASTPTTPFPARPDNKRIHIEFNELVHLQLRIKGNLHDRVYSCLLIVMRTAAESLKKSANPESSQSLAYFLLGGRQENVRRIGDKVRQ